MRLFHNPYYYLTSKTPFFNSMRIYKLFGSTSANDAAHVDIQKAGHIIVVQWAAYFNSIADNETFVAELSFTSTIQNTVNDAIGPISEIRDWTNFVTSGMAQGGKNIVVPMHLPVPAQARLYLNTSFSGTAAVAVYVHVR